MKKLFTIVALAFCALTINAQTTLSFSEVKAAGSLDGQTLSNTEYNYTLSLTITDTKGKVSIDENNARFGTPESYVSFDHRLKSGGKSSSANSMSLTIPADGDLLVYARSASGSATDRNLVLTQNDEELYNKVVQDADATSFTTDEGKTSKVFPVISVPVKQGTVDIAYPTGALNFYGFTFKDKAATGITKTLKAETAKDNATYNLAGQHLNKDSKGLVIRNGKKFINK